MSVYLIAQVVVLVIGLVLVAKHHKSGWMTPHVLSGVAFILLVLPSLASNWGY